MSMGFGSRRRGRDFRDTDDGSPRATSCSFWLELSRTLSFCLLRTMVRFLALGNIDIMFPQFETRWCRVVAYVFRGGRVCTPFKSSRPSSWEVEIVRPGASWTGRGALCPGEERTRYTEMTRRAFSALRVIR